LGIDDRDWRLTIEIDDLARLTIWRLGDLAFCRFGARNDNRQSVNFASSIDNPNRQSQSTIDNLNRQPSFSIANQQSKKPQSPIASPQSI
jgi:hypothetical protein